MHEYAATTQIILLCNLSQTKAYNHICGAWLSQERKVQHDIVYVCPSPLNEHYHYCFKAVVDYYNDDVYGGIGFFLLMLTILHYKTGIGTKRVFP